MASQICMFQMECWRSLPAAYSALQNLSGRIDGNPKDRTGNPNVALTQSGFQRQAATLPTSAGLPATSAGCSPPKDGEEERFCGLGRLRHDGAHQLSDVEAHGAQHGVKGVTGL
jgi:hypothetical protein